MYSIRCYCKPDITSSTICESNFKLPAYLKTLNTFINVLSLHVMLDKQMKKTPNLIPQNDTFQYLLCKLCMNATEVALKPNLQQVAVSCIYFVKRNLCVWWQCKSFVKSIVHTGLHDDLPPYCSFSETQKQKAELYLTQSLTFAVSLLVLEIKQTSLPNSTRYRFISQLRFMKTT